MPPADQSIYAEVERLISEARELRQRGELERAAACLRKATLLMDGGLDYALHFLSDPPISGNS